MQDIRIGIDADNGDFADGKSPAERIVSAVSKVLEQEQSCHIVLSGDEKSIRRALRISSQRVSILPSSEYCSQDREISHPIKGSSLNNLVQEARAGNLEAIFTIGDTHKVVIEGMRLRRNKGVEKPVLITPIPTLIDKNFILADVGATSLNQNIDIFADIEDDETFDKNHLKNRKPHLVAIDEFAREIYCQGIMAAVYARQRGVKCPSIGIVTVGEESHKGSDIVLRTDYLFRKQAGSLDGFLRYLGKIEPKDALLEGKVDIALSDGHTGNLLLKLSEAIIQLIKGIYTGAKEDLSFIEKALCLPAGIILRKTFKKTRARFDPDCYNAAILLGYSGAIIKGHGNSSERAISYGIIRTIECASGRFSLNLDSALETCMPRKPRYSPPIYAKDLFTREEIEKRRQELKK